MIKMITLLSGKQESSHAHFMTAWTRQHADLAAQACLPHCRRHAQWHLSPGRPAPEGMSPVTARVGGIAQRIDGIEETWFDDREAFGRYATSDELRRLDASHARFVGASKCLLVEEWEVKRNMLPGDTGDDKLKSLSFLGRKKDSSHEAFLRHWVDVHAVMILANASSRPRRYVQGHICDAPHHSRIAALQVDIDGIAELWFDDARHMNDSMSTPGAKAASEDGARFIGSFANYLVKEVEVLPRERWFP